ncbi:MAG: nitrite reductase [Bacillota bacterium]
MNRAPDERLIVKAPLDSKVFSGAQMAAVAKAAEPEGRVESTPQQYLLVTPPPGRREEVAVALRAAGLLVYGSGPSVRPLRVCSMCQGPVVEGLSTAEALNAAVADRAVPRALKVAYSGCPNGCAEPLIQDIGVIKEGDRFAVYVGGRGSGQEPLAARRLALVDEGELPGFVGRLVDLYAAEAQGAERFPAFVDRLGVERLRTA